MNKSRQMRDEELSVYDIMRHKLSIKLNMIGSISRGTVVEEVKIRGGTHTLEPIFFLFLPRPSQTLIRGSAHVRPAAR